jgi:hypothetical protein
MGRILSDTERLLVIVKLSNNNQHQQAAGKYQKMANEVRNPVDKKALWAAAENSRSKPS